jgi:hypothetical protein
MPSVSLSIGDFQSSQENVARMKLSNLYVAQNPLAPDQTSYIPRPTLSNYLLLPDVTAVRGLWSSCTNGTTSLFAVGDESLYRIKEDLSVQNLGSILGSSVCTFASSIYYTAIVSDGRLYLYDGTTLTQVIIPDNGRATNVTNLDNYLVIGIKGTNRFYWLLPGENTINPLSFASAERNPDDIVAVHSLGDELWLFGQTTSEVYASSGNFTAPFVRISGRVYLTGCLAAASIAASTKDTVPGLLWVSNNNEVFLSQGNPIKISNESVEELLKSSNIVNAWTFKAAKHDFFILSTDAATLVFDLTTDTWCRWSTYGQPNWAALEGLQINDNTYVINGYDNTISKLSANNSDGSADFLVCELSGSLLTQSSKPAPLFTVDAFMNYGFSSSYTVQPLVELRWSDDLGNTWSDYVQGQIGSRGSYDTFVSFRSLGLIRRPGKIIELRFSDVQSFRLDGVSFND